MQNDVVAIVDVNQNVLATYSYDPWGNCTVSGALASTIGDINPIRYRGYFYDSETGLYYLQSRYYDPDTCRFINADGYVSTGQGILGYNMYAYCNNNSINYVDITGELAGEIGILSWGITSGFANIWNPSGLIILGVTIIVAVAICVIPWDSVAQSVSNGLERVKDSANSISISLSISKAVSKAKTKIKNEKNRYDYWIAVYVEYGDGKGTYIPTTPISYSRAILYVRGGGNVFADSKNNAYSLALAVGNGRIPTKPETHQDRDGSTLGYWWHYHDGGRNGGHIFYVK